MLPGTSTSTGLPVLGAMKLGSTTRAESRMSGRSARTQSDAFHSSITRAGSIGICTRSVVPAEASMTNRSQAAPRWGASRERAWPTTRWPTSDSATSQDGSGPSNESSRVAAAAPTDANATIAAQVAKSHGRQRARR